MNLHTYSTSSTATYPSVAYPSHFHLYIVTPPGPSKLQEADTLASAKMFSRSHPEAVASEGLTVTVVPSSFHVKPF